MVTANDILEILQEQEFRCALTGKPLKPECAELDHKTPVNQGGTDDRENLHVIHKVINRMKHSLTVEEFRDWCALVASHEQG